MVRGRVDSGVQSVVRVMKVMVVHVVVGMVGMVGVVVGMEAMKAVGRLRAGEATGWTGVRSPPQRVTRGRGGGGRPQLDSRDRLVGARRRRRRRRRRRCGTEKKRDSFTERIGRAEKSRAEQSCQQASRLSDDAACLMGDGDGEGSKKACYGGGREQSAGTREGGIGK